jgi:hypothetical protein
LFSRELEIADKRDVVAGFVEGCEVPDMRGDGCVQLLPSCWIRPAVVRRAVMEMFAWRAARVRFAWVGGWKVRAVVFRPAVAGG